MARLAKTGCCALPEAPCWTSRNVSSENGLRESWHVQVSPTPSAAWGGGTQDRRPATTAEAVLHLVRADRLAIVITANKAPDDERRAVEAGAHGPLAKPISPRRLCEVVDALASGAAPHPTP